MAIYGDSFTYNGVSSTEYDVVLASIDNISTYEMGLSQSLIVGDMNKYRNRQNYNGRKYNDVLSFQFSIVRTPYVDGKQQYFTRADIRKINKWLTGADAPCVLHFDDDEEYIDYICLITDVDNTAYDGRIVELKYSVTCNAPYGYSEMQSIEMTVSSSENIRIVSNSDEINGYIYPKITINPTSTGEIQLKNTDENAVIIINAKKSLPITINCELQQFYDDIGLMSFEDLGITDISDIYIPRLKYGDNNFTVIGNCSIKFEWREPRKVGAY